MLVDPRGEVFTDNIRLVLMFYAPTYGHGYNLTHTLLQIIIFVILLFQRIVEV